MKRRNESDLEEDGLVTAQKLLSTWWRRLPPSAKRELGVKSQSPFAILRAIAKREDAVEFLESHVKRLSNSSWRDLYTATTIYHLLEQSELAYACANQCLKLLQMRHLHEQPDLKENLAYIKSLSSNEIEVLQMCTIAHLQKIGSLKCKDELPCLVKQDVQVVCSKDLTVDQFMQKFARPRKPVVIEGLQLTNGEPWTLKHISKVAGHILVPLKIQKPDSTEWARLETSSVRTALKDFISMIEDGSEKHACLFDWSLPLFCPELNSELSIPPYFDNDYLKRATSLLYKSSWPSLFVSPAGTVSELHVDAFGSNFWMALFSGAKKWTFFTKEAFTLLKPRYIDSFDPVFDFDTTSDCQDLSPYSVILRPGQVLFVPSGCPHRVENLETSVAISGNFVDDSNVLDAVAHLQRNALLDSRAGELLEEWLHMGLIK